MVKSVCLRADCFAFGDLLLRSRKSHHPKVSKSACSWLGSSCVGVPSLRSRSVGPRRTDIHVRNGALAASIRLGPLRETCVQPAPKSRSAVSGIFVYEDHKQINCFPAEAGPTEPTRLFRGTGLSAAVWNTCKTRLVGPAQFSMLPKSWQLGLSGHGTFKQM
jgi:hypothetical protein